ncbi:MAG: hypothetical protein WC440_00925 [Candidatus Omnitrophota bacterium]|jgi:hypothetical protein
MDNWILLALVIIIIYLIATQTNWRAKFASPKGTDETTGEKVGDGTSVDVDQTQSETPDTQSGDVHESMTRRMIMEGIATSASEDCATTGGESVSGNLDFAEWTAAHAIDQRVVQSNREFVADRMGNNQSWTGATWSPDRHESYDAVPWQGLARPCRVPVMSPDQIPDIDMTLNPAQRRVTWSST